MCDKNLNSSHIMSLKNFYSLLFLYTKGQNCTSLWHWNMWKKGCWYRNVSEMRFSSYCSMCAYLTCDKSH